KSESTPSKNGWMSRFNSAGGTSVEQMSKGRTTMNSVVTVVLMVASMSIGVISASAETPQAAKNAEAKGETALKRGDVEAAIASLSEAIKIDQKYVLAYTNRGFAYENASQPDKGRADMDEAARLNPKSTAAHYRRGEDFAEKHDLDSAIAEFSEAIRIDPKCT